MSIDRPTASEARSGAIRHPERPVPPVAVFAVHDEGDGISALYSSAFPTPALGALLEALDVPVGELVEHSPRWGVRSRPRSLATLAGRLELEIVHDPTGAEPEHGVLVDPARALPVDGRFAFHRGFDGHAIVFAREARVLEAALRAFLDAWATANGLERPPAPPEHGLRALTEALPAEGWHEAGLAVHPRHCVLTIRTRGATDDHAEIERWVGRAGGEWRTGWSW